MKIRSLIPTCSPKISSATDDGNSPPFQPKPHTPPPPLSLSDTTTATATASPPPSLNTTTTSSTSLYSNLSLQTLPSVPSLQNLSPETVKHTVTYLTVLKPYPTSPINFLSVHNHLLYAAAGNLIHVFDTTSFALLDTFGVNDSSSGSVKSITFHNKFVFTSHQDSKIRVWKLTDAITNARTSITSITSIRSTSIRSITHRKLHKHATTLPTLEDRLLRSILNRNYVNVRRHRRRLWIEHHDAVTGLKVINNNVICSVSWDTYLKIWKTSDLRCVESIKAHDDAINAVVVAGDGTIYTGSADCRIKVWKTKLKPESETETENGYDLVATLEKHKSAVNALALDGGGTALFSGACDRSILVWEKEESAKHMVVTGALRGHSKAILCLINVSDLLLSGSADRTVRIWRRGCGGKFCCLNVLDGHTQPVRSLTVDVDTNSDSSNDESSNESVSTISVFGGSLEGEIKIWKVEVLRLR